MTGLTVLPVLGQVDTGDQGNPNDPLVNEDANACFTGGSLEGQCGSDPLLWVAGWYRIRFDMGLLLQEDVPEWVQWVLPPPPPPLPPPTPTCSITMIGGLFELENPITVPLDVINGTVDPNGTIGSKPYSFDWEDLELAVLDTYNRYLLSVNGSWTLLVVSTDCPTPKPPAP